MWKRETRRKSRNILWRDFNSESATAKRRNCLCPKKNWKSWRSWKRKKYRKFRRPPASRGMPVRRIKETNIRRMNSAVKRSILRTE